MSESKLMLLRSIQTLHKTEFYLNHKVQTEIDSTTKRKCEIQHSASQQRVYLSGNHVRHDRWYTDPKYTDRVGKTHCASHRAVKTHRSECLEYEERCAMDIYKTCFFYLCYH